MFREVILFRDALTPNGPKKMNRIPKHPIRALLTALLLGLGACGETGTLPATEETPETARDAHVLALADALVEAQFMDFPTEADKVRYINALVGRPPWIETIADNIIEAEYMDFPTETERQDYVNALLGRPPGATPFFYRGPDDRAVFYRGPDDRAVAAFGADPDPICDFDLSIPKYANDETDEPAEEWQDELDQWRDCLKENHSTRDLPEGEPHDRTR